MFWYARLKTRADAGGTAYLRLSTQTTVTALIFVHALCLCQHEG